MTDFWRPKPDPDELMWGMGHHISESLTPILERVARNEEMSKVCESPIEVQFGAALKHYFKARGMPVYLVAQYQIERFRYDFAVLRWDGELVALIECDGKEFHATAEQVFNDRVKNALAAKLGVEMFRFTGSEIWRQLDECVYRVSSKVGWS